MRFSCNIWPAGNRDPFDSQNWFQYCICFVKEHWHGCMLGVIKETIYSFKNYIKLINYHKFRAFSKLLKFLKNCLLLCEGILEEFYMIILGNT